MITVITNSTRRLPSLQYLNGTSLPLTLSRSFGCNAHPRPRSKRGFINSKFSKVRGSTSNVCKTRCPSRIRQKRGHNVGFGHRSKRHVVGMNYAWKRYLIRERRGAGHLSRSQLPSGTNLTSNNNVVEESIFLVVGDRVKSFAIGTFAGLMGSLAGMGGGFVMIPLMTAAQYTKTPSFGGSAKNIGAGFVNFFGWLRGGLGLHQHQAHGTSLFAVGTTGLAGALGYGIQISGGEDGFSDQDTTLRKGFVELDTALALTLTAIITARAGALASNLLHEKTLQRALGAFMLVVAPLVPGKAYLDAWHDVNQPSNPDVERHLREDLAKHSRHEHLSQLERLVPASLIGVFSGFLSGMFGVGGGAIVVPSLVLSTDMSHHSALGTSLFAMVLPAFMGVYTHSKRGNVNWRVAPPLALGSALGAFVGGRDVGVHLDEDYLRYGFSCLMLVLGAKTWRKGGT